MERCENFFTMFVSYLIFMDVCDQSFPPYFIQFEKNVFEIIKNSRHFSFSRRGNKLDIDKKVIIKYKLKQMRLLYPQISFIDTSSFLSCVEKFRIIYRKNSLILENINFLFQNIPSLFCILNFAFSSLEKYLNLNHLASHFQEVRDLLVVFMLITASSISPIIKRI